MKPRKCPCSSGKETEGLLDGYGIFMCYVCEDCRDRKVKKFRPDIFDQYDTDEQIEEDY